MKKFIFLTAAALWLPAAALAGEITPGSVPGNISYQGRLERDNAPITGPVYLHFRLFNSLTATGGACGSPGQPCLWESPEITVQAAQGIFSADLTPPIEIFTGGQKLYIEVQVESDTLSPREPLNSVAYAHVAKKLEDGSAVIVTSITAGYQVYLATNTGASVGIGGTIKPGTKLTVDGDIEMINGGVIRYPDGSSQPSALIGGVVGGITSSADATIVANTDSTGSDNILFGLPNVVGAGEKMRITNAGDVGVGTPVPMGRLDVNGSLYVGNEGIYDRADGEVNIKEDLIVEGGKVTGMNSENISLGETDNVIAFNSNGGERARIHSNDFFGVGITAPTSMIHSGADIAAEGGVRGGRVSIGDYSSWTNRLNEIMAENGYNLLLQQSTPFNVGIGTDTPREKLHVRGSIRSDYGIIAATGAFSGDVSVTGDFRALGSYKEVFLTSTTIYGNSKIYGDLLITGGIGSMAGMPAYIASTQTFSGGNTFLGQVAVSSDAAASGRLGAGVMDFDFPGSKYLQVGDNKTPFAYDNSLVYLVAGSSAEAKIGFYRGTVSGTNPPIEMARLETQSGNILPNLALVVNGQVKTLTDSTYHRIQNSVVWISTGYAGTPSIFVSSSMGNVGMGTTVLDPNWRLTVDGNIRISGSGKGLIFPDGTSLVSGNLGALSVGNVSNNSDAVVQSDADQSAGGDVILRAGAVDGLVLKSGGNIGIGTVNPVSKLNIRGGDLVLGTPVNPYGADSIEDLVVGGNIVFDGELLQRSASQVKLSGLLVGGDVYLSTGTGKRTGIGTETPLQRLQVAGDINIETGFGLRINNTAPSGQYLRGDGTRFSSSLIVAAELPGTIVRTTQTITTTPPLAGGGDLSANRTFSVGGLNSLGTANYVVGVNGGAGAWEYKNIVGAANEIDVTHGVGTLTIGIIDPLIVTKGGTGAAALTDGGILYGGGTGPISALPVMTNGQLLIGDGTTAPSVAGLTGTSNQVTVTNGAGTITLSLPQDIHSGASPAFTSLTATSSGTFKAVTGYSIDTSSGILVRTGIINMSSNGKIINLVDPTVNQDAATKKYVDDQLTAGVGTTWSRGGNNILITDWLGSSNAQDVVIKRSSAEKMRAISTGINVTGNITVSGTVDGYDISASGANWDTAYTHSQDAAGAVHGATNLNSASMIVRRDVSGNFSAGTITATLSGSITGNAATATNATTHIGDVTGGVHGAVSANTINMIVRRDASGNFSAGTISADLTGNVTGTVSGNAGTVTNGVYTAGNQTIGGTKTFSSMISGDINGNAATVTNGVYTAGNQTVGGIKTFSSTISGDINGNAATATKPAAAGTSGQVVCWKVDGSLGSCSGAVSGTSSCTCN